MKHTLTSLAIALAATSSAFAGADIVTVVRFDEMYHYRSDTLHAPISSAALHTGSGPIRPVPIDYRPSSGQLYGATDTALYTIDTATGLATLVGNYGITITNRAMDFDPVSGELRMVGTVGGVNGLNIRINPDTGAVIATEQPFIRVSTSQQLIPLNIAHTSDHYTGTSRLLAMYGVPEGFPWDRWMLGEVGSAAGGMPSFNAGSTADIGLINAHSWAVNSTAGFDISTVDPKGYTLFTVGSGLGGRSNLATVNLATGQMQHLGILNGMPQGASSVAVRPAPSCSADANGDAQVDGADLSPLLATFGQNVKPGEGADFNGDGIVDAADLSVLLAGFGLNCVAP